LIGIHTAHQNLDQTDTALRATLLASTSIKFAGGLSSKDANTLDSEFRTDAAFLLGQKKYAKYTEFACYVRNYTSRALSVRIPLGYVDSLPTMSDSAYERLLGRIRREYSAPPTEQPPKPPPKPKAAPEQGRGGKQHKYLQQLIKQLADARGFRASIEEMILDDRANGLRLQGSHQTAGN
jgi:hypothetical protein